ncbi:hypothetical protein PG994_009005 [Apiospora phragmitis]|uniref:Uncharacterized protein n=1 Tax=Apiospora phragmitis TaxID=2905665 RepID=A0ABR1UI23_9PEZI
MADINVLISNGTCYKSTDEESYRDYIPCGNVASGQHYQCCSKGDICLSSNACFNIGDSQNTYLAGCTDQSYKADACPNKGVYAMQEWVGLTHCDGEHNKRGLDVDWLGCDEDLGQPSVTSGNRTCDCTNRADMVPLFTDGQILTKHASLPRTLSGTIIFVEGYKPTAASSPTQQPSKVDDGGVTGTPAPEASSGTGTPAAAVSASPSSSSLSTTALAGIGAGAGVGVIIIVIAFVFLALRYRRLKAEKETGYRGLRPSPAGTSGPSSLGKTDDGNYDGQASPNAFPSAGTPAQHYHHSGDNSGHSHGFFKAELPADSPNVYQAYDPDRDRWVPPLSAISERSNETMMNSPSPLVSPQSTGETAAAHGAQHGQRSGGMDPIYEMQA